MSDRAVRWTVSLATAASIVLLGAWAGALATADTPPTLTAPTVTPNPQVPGGTVTVTGTGCTADVAGSSAPVTSTVTSTTTSTITQSIIPTTTDITTVTSVPTTLATTQTVTSTNTSTSPPVTSTATITSPVVTTTVPATITGVPTTITSGITPPITQTNTVTTTTTTTPTPTTPTVTVELVNGTQVIATPDPVPAGSDGSWTVTITIPATTGPGTYTIASACGSTNYPGPVQLTVAAALLPGVQVNPQIVQVGGSFDIAGENFVPNETVNAELHSTPVQLATFTAKSDGTVSGTATVPAGTALGQHQVELVGAQGDSASAILTVISPATAPAQHTSLAATGTNSTLTYEGLTLLIIGLATVISTWQWTIASERLTATRRKKLTPRATPVIRWEAVPEPATHVVTQEEPSAPLLPRQRRRH